MKLSCLSLIELHLLKFSTPSHHFQNSGDINQSVSEALEEKTKQTMGIHIKTLTELSRVKNVRGLFSFIKQCLQTKQPHGVLPKKDV